MLTGVFLGLAFLTKFYPIVLFPALWRRWRLEDAGDDRGHDGGVLLDLSFGRGRWCSGSWAATYVEEEGIQNGTRYFLLELVQHLPGLHETPNGVFLGFAAVVFAGLMVWCWRVATPLDARPAAFLAPAFGLAAALMLLFSPHYPWYVAWLIPFLCLMPNLPMFAYIGGLFYLCTTELAVGYGAEAVQAERDFYGRRSDRRYHGVGRSLRRLPQTRAWFLPALSDLTGVSQGFYTPIEVLMSTLLPVLPPDNLLDTTADELTPAAKAAEEEKNRMRRYFQKPDEQLTPVADPGAGVSSIWRRRTGATCCA